MRTVHCAGDAQVFVVDAEIPTPGAGQVLVRTVVSALCGSELKTYRGAGLPQGNSGHEAAGIVAAVGDGVTALAVGDRVGCSAIAGCGACDRCREGRYTWCKSFRFFGQMHAEFFVIPALACHRLPDDLDWDAAVLLTGDGMGVPFHSASHFAELGAEPVAVFGLGPIGLGHVLLQRHLGRRVIGIDRAPDRLRLAREWGAEVIEAGDDAPAQVRALTRGEGAAVCIEASGTPGAAKQCFSAVRTAGLVVFNGEQSAVELSPSDDFIRRDIRAAGAWFYHFCEFAPMLALQRAGLGFERLVTHRFPLESAADAYRAMAEGRTGKALLVYAG